MKHIALADRVAAAFDKETADAYGDQYLDAVVQNWREIARAMRRSLLVIVALMAGFFLLQNAKNTEITLGPLKLTNVSAVLTVIPALVAVLGYEVLAGFFAYVLCRDTITALMKVLHPSIHENDLQLLLVPPTTSLIGGVGSSWEDLRNTAPGMEEKVLVVTSTGIFVAIVIGGFAFFGYSYIHLYADRHANMVAVSVSCLAAAVYVVRTLALLGHGGEYD